MNKKLVIAALLALGSAQDAEKKAEVAEAPEECNDVATGAARAAMALAQTEKERLEGEKTTLEAFAKDCKTKYEAAKVNSDNADTVGKAYVDALVAAEAAYKAQTDAQATQEAIITKDATAITDKEKEVQTNTEAIAALTTPIATAKTNLDDQDATVTQHEAEVKALAAVLETKTTEETTATNLVTSTLLAYDIEKEKKAGCAAKPCKAGGEVFAGATKDKETATTNETNAVALITNFSWGTAKSDAVTAKQLYAQLGLQKLATASVCTGPDCSNGDSIYALQEASKDSALSTQDGVVTSKTTTWDTEADKMVALYQDAYFVKARLKAAATEVETAITSAIGTTETAWTNAKSALETATAAKTTANTAKTLGDDHLKEAKIEQVIAKKLYDDLVAKKANLEDAKIILNWELGKLKVATDAAKIAKAAAVAKQTDLKKMQDSAGKDGAGLRARQRCEFFNLFTNDLKADMVAADLAVTENQKEITKQITKKDGHSQELDAATLRCKRRLYVEAMDALKAKNKAESEKEAKSAALKKAYAAKAVYGTDCSKDAEGTRKDLCEGENTCCGQANRYDRDGTRRSIEVCGTTEKTTYTYWPEFKTGMLKEPQSEEWRYYCLAGAGSLAASASALAVAIFFAQ